MGLISYKNRILGRDSGPFEALSMDTETKGIQRLYKEAVM